MSPLKVICASMILGLSGLLVSCGANAKPDLAAEAPPPAKIEEQQDANLVSVRDASHFPIVTAQEFRERPSIDVNGTVSADVSRTVPVISLASGRVVELKAQLGDVVKKGQLLLRVQSNDVSSAYNDYQNAVADESLARTQLSRAQLLFDKGAIAHRDLEVAQDAETKGAVLVRTTGERLRNLGVDPDRPTAFTDIVAPVSGVIIEQNVTNAAGVKTLDNSPNLFTIADLTSIWVLCDVYENDLSSVKLGETADVRFNAYPDRLFHARISNIGQVLDQATRTAKVRLALTNRGGMMKAGMFATATFHGSSTRPVSVVPATSILHLHDRDWVYLPADGSTFRRVEVITGAMHGDDGQIVTHGVSPGQKIVANALQLSTEAQQ